jgi:GH18 family chitinase
MISQVKIYVGIAVTAIVGILFALLRIERVKKEAAETVADTYKDAAVENANVIEEIKQSEKIKMDTAKLTNDDVFSELRKYDRSRKDQDTL